MIDGRHSLKSLLVILLSIYGASFATFWALGIVVQIFVLAFEMLFIYHVYSVITHNFELYVFPHFPRQYKLQPSGGKKTLKLSFHTFKWLIKTHCIKSLKGEHRKISKVHFNMNQTLKNKLLSNY